METDFRLEAAAASEFAENVAGETDFRIPASIGTSPPPRCSRSNGSTAIKLSDQLALAAKGYDLPSSAPS